MSDKELDVSERLKACNDEIRAVLEKYGCIFSIGAVLTLPEIQISTDKILPILRVLPAKEPSQTPNG